MLGDIWFTFLYQPTFNALIFIYNEWTAMNMGWAIVYLTIILRIALLPFTLINEKNRVRNQALAQEIRDAEKEFARDPVLQKEEVRKILKKRKVQPWAKAVVLGIQGLVLVLLYQVFIGGITGERMLNTLYASIKFPGTINTVFFGTDLDMSHNIIWSIIVGLYLFIEIYVDYRRRKRPPTQGDLVYFILFPLAVFVVLWFLPMVKALFILTSMVFSTVVHQLMVVAFRPKEEKKPA